MPFSGGFSGYLDTPIPCLMAAADDRLYDARMIGRCPFSATMVAAAALAVAVPLAALAKAPSGPSKHTDVVGMYDGGQTEMAVGLELRDDGRFRYGLSYGALDEQAQGTWTSNEDEVLLTSDPFVPPRFVLVNRLDAPVGQLKIILDLPDGMSRQYFDAEVRLADGRVVDHQLNDRQEPLAFDPRENPVSVALTLPIFGLRSETLELSGVGGSAIRFRFEPNALGTVAFSKTALRKDHGTLILLRHDRTIRFRRLAGAEAKD